MPDLKTNLREMSFAVGISCLLQEPSSFHNLSHKDIFLNIARKYVIHSSMANNIFSNNYDWGRYQNICSNGFNLAKYIFHKFQFNNSTCVEWKGFQKNVDPVDVYVGEFGFSLKEDSFILENMGLYKFLGLLTNRDFPRGMNVFSHFAPQEYNEWFNYTWSKMTSNKTNWEKIVKAKNKRDYKVSINFGINNVELNFDNRVVSKVPIHINTTEEYLNYTSSVTREKVFAKWIADCTKNDSHYVHLKHHCSSVAGKNLCEFVTNNYKPEKLVRFLQFREKEYYYAKSTNQEIHVYKIPSSDQFNKTIQFKSIEYSVPSSQLNIFTEIENIKTGKTLLLRNECRFSHGQFNGVPEAKMYYDNGTDLSIIYEQI